MYFCTSYLLYIYLYIHLISRKLPISQQVSEKQICVVLILQMKKEVNYVIKILGLDPNIYNWCQCVINGKHTISIKTWLLSPVYIRVVQKWGTGMF